MFERMKVGNVEQSHKPSGNLKIHNEMNEAIIIFDRKYQSSWI